MTEKTLSQRLPVGAARNKVEFLADEFEKTAADLLRRLALLETGAGENPSGSEGEADKGSDVVNLLINSDFTASPNWLAGHGDKWIASLSSYTGQTQDSCVIGKGTAVPMPYGWCAELNIKAGESSASCGGNILTDSGETLDLNFKENASCAFLLSGYYCDVIMYQPFDMPCVSYTSSDPLKRAPISAYYRGFAKNKVARFGIIELDNDYRFVSVIAEQPVQEENNTSRLIHQFIHGISLQAGKKYAYFIETKELNGFGNSINATGVFINPDSADIIPPPNIAISSIPCYGQFGTFTNAEITGGITAKAPLLPMHAGVDRHLMVQHVTPELNASGGILDSVIDGDAITLTGTSVSDSTVNVRYYYSHFPMKLKFYT